MKLREILKLKMDGAGDNPYSLSEKSGVPQPTIQRILSGQHDDPRSSTVKKLADAYGLSTGELRGETQELQVVSSRLLPTWSNQIDIPQFDVSASMGHGLPQPEDEPIVARMSVNREWIKSILPAISGAQNLQILTGHGDSMEGTFRDGDLLVVDTGVKDVRIDAVYVLALNDELYVKRLQRRPDGTILMISDNKKYEPYLIQNGEREKFQVLGRVVLAWNANKL